MGYVYDFEVDGGLGSKSVPTNCDPPAKCDESGFVVLRLSNDLNQFQHELFFENYFSSPESMRYLKQEKKIWAVATLNTERSRQCLIPTEKEMNDRGFCQEFVDKKKSIVFTACFDNKRVLTISIYIGKEPLHACKRYDKTSKKKIDIERLHSVAVYNKFIGRVDKADMLLSLYHTKYRSRKWYHQIGFHLFSLAALNSLFTNR